MTCPRMPAKAAAPPRPSPTTCPKAARDDSDVFKDAGEGCGSSRTLPDDVSRGGQNGSNVSEDAGEGTVSSKTLPDDVSRGCQGQQRHVRGCRQRLRLLQDPPQRRVLRLWPAAAVNEPTAKEPLWPSLSTSLDPCSQEQMLPPESGPASPRISQGGAQCNPSTRPSLSTRSLPTPSRLGSPSTSGPSGSSPMPSSQGPPTPSPTRTPLDPSPWSPPFPQPKTTGHRRRVLPLGRSSSA